MSEEYKEFLNWCENKWTYEYKMKKLLSKLSNDDIDFLKEQYETRLKADIVAMLEDIRIEALESFCSSFSDYDNLIQQKINALKGEKDV